MELRPCLHNVNVFLKEYIKTAFIENCFYMHLVDIKKDSGLMIFLACYEPHPLV